MMKAEQNACVMSVIYNYKYMNKTRNIDQVFGHLDITKIPSSKDYEEDNEYAAD